MSNLLSSPFLHSSLDNFLRAVALPSAAAKFFSRGVARDPGILAKLYDLKINEEKRFQLLHARPDIEWSSVKSRNRRAGTVTLCGKFTSPAAHLLPPECEEATFELLLPVDKSCIDKVHTIDDVSNLGIPVVCLLPPTSDFTTAFRLQLLGMPLAKRGIGSILPMIPYYGKRKPKGQVRACLHYLSDLFAIGAGSVAETSAVLLELQSRGFGPFGSAGISLGGYITGALCTTAPLELAAVPIVLPSSATAVFTQGVLSNVVDFRGSLSRDLSDETKRQAIFNAIQLTPDKMTVPREFFEPAKANVRESTSFTDSLVAGSTELLNLARIRQQSRSEEQIDTMFAVANILEHVTSLDTYPQPKRPDAIIQVMAKHDQYLCCDDGSRLFDAWQGSHRVLLEAGHVSALFHQRVLVDTIVQSLEYLQRK